MEDVETVVREWGAPCVGRWDWIDPERPEVEREEDKEVGDWTGDDLWWS